MNDQPPFDSVPGAGASAASDSHQTPDEKFAEFRDFARQAFDDARVGWKDVGDQAAQYIKENPGKAVLAGLGVGYLLGLMTRR